MTITISTTPLHLFLWFFSEKLIENGDYTEGRWSPFGYAMRWIFRAAVMGTVGHAV